MSENKKRVIFQSTDAGATRAYDDKGLVLKFNRLNLNIITTASGEKQRTNESDVWICVVEDENVVERAKKLPGFGRVFKIVDKVPTQKSVSTIKHFDESFDKETLTQKAMRYGELKGLLLKKDGSFRADADEVLVSEFNELKDELGV